MHQRIQQAFGVLTDLVREHARAEPGRRAVVVEGRSWDYATLDATMDRVAAALQREGLRPGDAVAVCATTSQAYVAVFLGALRAGVVVAPLAPGSTRESLAGMVANAQARLLFTDAACAETVGAPAGGPPRVALDDDATVGQAFSAWLAPQGAQPEPVAIAPSSPFNIIYSSGTTGEPKGIVQSHAMRWSHLQRGQAFAYGPGTVTLLATPLYSNTTLVVFFPSLAFGATLVLMPKFSAQAYVRLAQDEGATHTMLVPVQYQRIMALPDLERYDLGTLSLQVQHQRAVFGSAQGRRAGALARWPGRVLRHDRGRRHLHPRSPRASRQAAHRGPAGRHQRHPPDRRSRPRTAGGPGWRGGGPFARHDDRLPPAGREDTRGRMVRCHRQALHPHRRCRPLRRRRLPRAVRPAQGHDHLRRLQHLSQ